MAVTLDFLVTGIDGQLVAVLRRSRSSELIGRYRKEQTQIFPRKHC